VGVGVSLSAVVLRLRGVWSFICLRDEREGGDVFARVFANGWWWGLASAGGAAEGICPSVCGGACSWSGLPFFGPRSSRLRLALFFFGFLEMGASCSAVGGTSSHVSPALPHAASSQSYPLLFLSRRWLFLTLSYHTSALTYPSLHRSMTSASASRAIAYTSTRTTRALCRPYAFALDLTLVARGLGGRGRCVRSGS
jgi:hypothetical protein